MEFKTLPDIFSDYPLQREDILARVARQLQLDKTRREKMEAAYLAVSQLLSSDEDYFKDLDMDIYTQGSVSIGTTVRPLNGDEFDLDLVLHIKKPYKNFNPPTLFNKLYQKLRESGIYGKMTEAKRRCVRLNYSGEFHMDILPGCMLLETDLFNINVPDRELRGWTQSNPKGYSEWFLTVANRVERPMLEGYYRIMLEMKVEVEKIPEDDFYTKKPLQTAVQIIKRYRDIYFDGNEKYATSSIVLTTLAAQFYSGERSVYETIDNFLLKTQQSIDSSSELKQRFKVFNPVNGKEEFTEKWTADTYKHFFAFLQNFYYKWSSLKRNFAESGSLYQELFGQGLYKGAIKEQVELFGKSSSIALINSSAVLLGNYPKTDRKGNINEEKGYRNERHRDFGE